MYDRILVPTDGSETAERAMTHAVDLAGRYDADVHVLHVISTRRYDTSIDSAVEPLREDGEEYVSRLAETAAQTGVDVTTAVELGKPAEGVLTYVEGHDVALVVMGTRGRGGLPNRLLGTVTHYIVTHSPVPVHVVPPSSRDRDHR